MSVSARALAELHRIHKQLGDLRERKDRGPRQIKVREVNLGKQNEELARLQAEQKAAKIRSDQKNLLLRSSEQKIEDLKVKLNQASSNREYQALKDQIAADQMAGSVLADEILEAMEKVDELAAHIAEQQKNIEVKEIQLRPKTDDHHLGFKIRDARKWIEDGMKVRVRIRFRGREITHADIGRDRLARIAAELNDIAVVEQLPNMEGSTMLMVLAPASDKKK